MCYCSNVLSNVGRSALRHYNNRECSKLLCVSFSKLRQPDRPWGRRCVSVGQEGERILVISIDRQNVLSVYTW